MDTIFVTAKIFPPYDPSPAMAHRPKLEKAEEESKKQAKDLIKAQKYLLEMEKKVEEAERMGDSKKIEKLQELFMENLKLLDEQQ